MVITVECPSCHASFPVDSNKVPEGGVKARCSSCAHVFRVEKPAEDAGFDAVEPAAAADTGVADSPDDWVIENEETADESSFFGGGGAAVEEADPLPSFEEEAVADEPLPTFGEEATAEAADPLPSFGDEAVAEEPMPSFGEEPAAEEALPSFGEEPAEEEALPSFGDEPLAMVEETVEEEPAEDDSSVAPVKGFTFGKRDPKDKARRLARVLVSDMISYNAERHETALANGTVKEDFEDEIEKSWKEYVDQVGPEMAEGDGQEFWREALNDVLAKGQPLF